ncbi:MAG: gamma-glutamyl-gamma-aminobutyrate hydrolase family protein [Woeseiaceae bacterium]|nr:gamma-glutamyl-gamma-aminobutyrate hydrolase family protein [Woeseiaceae bacterium]MDG1864864.1 gamma-glutamyl-gamma-aminobutyrate hydrolase family protein [Woeseiaceae bacterium]
MSSKPVIAVPACRRFMGIHPFHMVGEKYITALKDATEGLPWMIPAINDDGILDAVLAKVDGLFLTGSYSDIEPHHYQGKPSRSGTLHDPERDATVFSVTQKALDMGIPIFAVCRGFQELNVLLGGTLHQQIHEVEGFFDHRENKSDPIEKQYGPAHKILLKEGSLLSNLTGQEMAIVNSLHGQGIDQIAPGLDIEAVAEDGVIEAFKVRESISFAYAVQWHPEWQVMENPLSLALFRAFGEACRKYALAK